MSDSNSPIVEMPKTPILKTISIEPRREDFAARDEFAFAWKEYVKHQEKNYFYKPGDCYVCIDGKSVYCPPLNK
jgi:hypothetical protein